MRPLAVTRIHNLLRQQNINIVAVPRTTWLYGCRSYSQHSPPHSLSSSSITSSANLSTSDRRFHNTPTKSFKYSEPLPEDLYLNNPDYFSNFQPRRHLNAQLADEGCHQHYTDWVKNVGETSIIGCLNIHGGCCAALFAPECLPERLSVVSYTAEYSFFHDGKC